LSDDPTLSLDLAAITEESKRLAASVTPASGRWDVIVVGSGAAGGMAAFQLATSGVKVLLLEAGRLLDWRKEYRTMEWPYKSMRRHRLPPDTRAIHVAEYDFERPYGAAPGFGQPPKLVSYAGNTFTRNWVVNEREHPTTGTRYAWVRARVLGGKTNFWGRCALRYGPLQFKAASHDGYDVDWPISYDEVAPYYDKVDRLLGISGTKEGLITVPDGVFQRPTKLNCVEVRFQRAVRRMGRHYIPGRAGVTTDGVLNNKYRARCVGRGRCGRGCDLHAPFHSPTALVYPARDTGNVTIRPYSIVSEVMMDEAGAKATGVRVIDANSREVLDFKAPVVVLGAGTLDSTRILLNSRSRQHPQGLGNSSGLLGCYLSEHIMGIRGSGFIPQRIGTDPTNDDGRPITPYMPRFRNVTDRHPDFIRGYHYQGGGGAGSFPDFAHDTPGFGKAFKSSVRRHYPALISLGGFGEVLPRKENRVLLDPAVKDAWGIPVLKFDYRFGDNELKMAKDMADQLEEMLAAAGAENVQVRREPYPEGWSIHEIGTARMGDDPKSSVTDRFCRLHDVKNVYVADASSFVSGGTQNTTWSILAMCWRTMDHLKEQLRAGKA